MQKIMFNERFGLQRATFDRKKTMTRRVALKDPVEDMNVGYDTKTQQCIICSGNRIVARSKYGVGEKVAIAQAYIDVYSPTDFASIEHAQSVMSSPGWLNKMFVKAELMPHHIRITGIKVEPLCGISNEDCFREGIMCEMMWDGSWESSFIDKRGVCNGLTKYMFRTPYDAFKGLIDKLNRPGFFESNPIVFVYTYELID